MGPEILNYRFVRLFINGSAEQKLETLAAIVTLVMLLRHYVLPNRLTGRNYTNLTQNSLPEYMEDMLLESRP